MATESLYRRSVSWRSFGRPPVGIVVVFALIIQFLGVASGLPLGNGDPGFATTLCQHDSQGSPIAPADPPEPPCVKHCLACLAGVNHALAAPEATGFRTTWLEVEPVIWQAHERRLPQSPPYAIARPRGPPLSA
jgi:hypothetical protein